MSNLQIQAYDFIEAKVDKQVDTNTKHLATKEDLSEIRSELAKTIYIVGLVQFLAIVGSVIAIMSFMLKH